MTSALSGRVCVDSKRTKNGPTIQPRLEVIGARSSICVRLAVVGPGPYKSLVYYDGGQILTSLKLRS